MSNLANDKRIDYIEFPSTDVAATRRFYETVFGWKFEDYGPDYTSFVDGRIAGGFYKAEGVQHGVLVVLYAADLEAAQECVTDAGGRIVKETFSFPGGRRFHFADPGGNQLAIWSE